jgi:hypothetical protein
MLTIATANVPRPVASLDPAQRHETPLAPGVTRPDPNNPAPSGYLNAEEGEEEFEEEPFFDDDEQADEDENFYDNEETDDEDEYAYDDEEDEDDLFDEEEE